MNRDDEAYEDPVELPEGVHHGSLRAYNAHKCRCRYCVRYRRLYDSMDRYRKTSRRRDGATAYLARRGVYLSGRGTFSRSPGRLAQIIAEYLGDDLPF